MKPRYSGKVREIYDVSPEELVIVTTDRISAFDHILPQTVPGKGIVLNQLSSFWFRRTQSIVPNHILSERLEDMPAFFQQESFRDRTVLVRKLQMLPFEFVVRGYLFGSMWEAYRQGLPFCGYQLPPGYQQAEKLDAPLLTPAIKKETGHDEYIDMATLEDRLGSTLTHQVTDICFQLYNTCAEYALSKGILIADAKFEFGMDQNGTLTLADELFTPDASRFWDLQAYAVGTFPKSLDKQLLRDWLQAHKENGQLPDRVPEEILQVTGERYQRYLQQLVGVQIP